MPPADCLHARQTSLLSLAALLVLLPAAPTYAHRLNIFACTEGEQIVGSAYFAGGGRPANMNVLVLNPGGRELGRAITNAEGEFTFTPTHSVDHHFVINTGDGHRAEFVVPADELPAGRDEPVAATASNVPTVDDLPSKSDKTASPADQPASAAPRVDEAALERIVRSAVSKEVAPLRQQLDEQAVQVRMRDVIGGIGYIVGLAALTYYLVRRRSNHDAKS